MKRARRVLLPILAVLSVLAVITIRLVNAQATDGVVISSPQSGASVIDTDLQISGTSPAGILVDVAIKDTDTTESLVKHQPFAEVDGTVTSDDTGHWTFIPQKLLVPGQFSVEASYTDKNNKSISSNIVRFVIINDQGASHVLSKATWRNIIGLTVVGLLLLVWLIIYLLRRRRRKNQFEPETETQREATHLDHEDHDEPEAVRQEEKPKSLFSRTPQGKQFLENQDKKLEALDKEAAKIEEELAVTAERLEATNEQVNKFREEILTSKAPKTKTEKADSTSDKESK